VCASPFTEPYARSAWPLVGWIAYGSLLPAALMIGAAAVFGRDEVARLTAWERAHAYARELPLAAITCGVAGLVALFVWINLGVYEHFGTGPVVEILFERHPTRDLTTSIAWILYALALLGLGMLRARVELRWASLGFLILSLAKVFLHDLGELEGLYRVGSLTGLALSLLLVSALYQRFVFRARRPAGEGAP
jgi:uncharacterized membrane protein